MLNLQITDYEREVILLDDQFVRTRILLGDEAMQILKNSRYFYAYFYTSYGLYLFRMRRG